MVKFYNSLSPTTKLVLQSFSSVLGSVLVGVGAAAYQNYTQAGHLDLQALLNISLLTFALLFGKAMHDWVPAHAQQLLQAANDEKTTLYNALQRQQQISSAVVATQSKQVQSTSLQAQQTPVQPVVVQTSSSLQVTDIQAIAAQLAINLMNMSVAASTNSPALTPKGNIPPVQTQPKQDAYIDPLKVSAVLPAYKPMAIPDQPTQSVPVPQT